jgi:hypothetical protein
MNQEGQRHTGKVTVLHHHRLPNSRLGHPKYELILRVNDTGETLRCRTRTDNFSDGHRVLPDNLEGRSGVASWTFKERGPATLTMLELLDKSSEG